MKRSIKDEIKKCNFCNTTENLCIDKLGRIHRICNNCKLVQSNKGRETQKLKILKKYNPYITRSVKGSIIDIDKKFFEKEYINQNILLEDLAKQYQTKVHILRKYLLLYSIGEYNLCRHCGTRNNLLYMENRVCNCCVSCWKDTYSDRKYYRVEKKKGKFITTSGIGIKAQFFFMDLEKELNNRNIIYNELVYGFYDSKNKKRIKSEKCFKVINIENGKDRRRFADCYLDIKNKNYIIEFDENRHNEGLNYIQDIKRESEFYNSYPNIKILRVSEQMLKDQGKDFIIKYLIEAILTENFNLFKSINDNYLHDCFVDQEFDRHVYN